MAVTLKPLSEQVIVITGASSGIGLVTARAAAKAGAKVVLVARDGETLVKVAAEIEAAGGAALAAPADVGVLAEVQRAAAKAVERFGRIDTWVNNAGVAIYAKLVDTPMAEHEQLFRTNYFGAVHGCLTAIEHLQREGESLITVASIAADIPSPVMGAYAASKHAVKGYVHALRIEVEADRLPIVVSLIKPAGIDTPIAEHAANHVDGEALIPPPVYDPEVVAAAILDAAVHSRRDVTVGGAGRAQTLVVEHFPGAFDKVGRWFAPLLQDQAKPKTPGNNLEATMGEGRERSREQPGRSFSVYTSAARHPRLLAAGVAGVAGFAGLLLFAGRGKAPAKSARARRKPR